MKTLRVAQITDIHLMAEADARLHGVDTAVSLQKVLDAIDELSPQAEIIIATGDLAEDGSIATYRRLRRLLASIKIPLYVLAGNHDGMREMHDTLVGETIKNVDLARAGEWIFLFVNTQVPGESYGHISPDEMSLLKANLELAGETPVVVSLHHTPMPVCQQTNCQLLNVADFNQLVEGFPCVKAVIAGHTHIEAEQVMAGHIQFTTPSTFAQFTHDVAFDSGAEGYWMTHTMDGSKHGFRVLDLMPDGRVSSQVHWVYDH